MVNLQFPINSVSFGQVSLSILNQLDKINYENYNLFPIGNQVDFSSYSYDHEFIQKLVNNCQSSLNNYCANEKTFKLWHINGAESSIGNDNHLITFHETDRITKTEKNILNNQQQVYVTSKYTKKVFESAGLNNINYWPLWMDKVHYKPTKIFKKKYLTFGLFGKLEKRKAHLKVIKAWVKAYGNKDDYRLNCCINNPFLFKPNRPMSEEETKIHSTEATKRYIQQELDKDNIKLPWNINFLHSEKKNDIYNRVLNATDIVLGMSHCEGFDLPLFQCLNLGKGAVVFNSHVHKDYCTENNSVLVEPSGKIDCYDGMFFQKGESFNQGQWEDWEEDEFISAMQESESKTFIQEELDNTFKFNNIF